MACVGGNNCRVPVFLISAVAMFILLVTIVGDSGKPL